jgi:non-ribosomal peptide synthetase component F
MSWEEAVAAVTAPGERFALADTTVDGITQTLFTAAPPSLRTIFDSWAGRGDDLFLVYEDERRSFADVAEETAALGAALVGRYGVRPGDRVAIAMRNLPEWVISFAAITSIGAVAVSLNGWWTADELDYGLDDSGASVLIADPPASAWRRSVCAWPPVWPPRASTGGTTWSCAAPSCRSSRWTPTTTPRSSTPRARRVGPRARCRPIEP